ncbi:MAG: N-acetylmuramoyl-L-alanine amidase [Gammaproteobacteria bacterium]|nr:N-acetylmuramoyl-L-alanine amidase [Gammaproteobacteria bacterium]
MPISRRQLLAGWGGFGLSCAFRPARAAATVSAVKVVQQDNVMLHIDLDQPVPGLKLFTLDDPHRLVIDLPFTVAHSSLANAAFEEGAVAAVRFGVHDAEHLRIVVDMREASQPAFRHVNRQGSYRLLVDLGVPGVPDTTQTPPEANPLSTDQPLRNVVIAIDAGHGGKDPGALGQRRTQEKDVTLNIAIRLHNRLAAQPGITPVLTRETDVFLTLRDRIRVAREKKADIFVSIHADAFKRKAAAGSSVYALSLKGASSEAAAWLAKKENEVDALFGDVALDGLSDDLKSTLLDLAQNTTLEASLDLGGEVLQQLKEIGPVHKQTVEQANFAVLKSPDIPSILIETAFISNLQEEKKLNNARYQETLAKAIQDGLLQFLKRRAPEGTHYHANRSG